MSQTPSAPTRSRTSRAGDMLRNLDHDLITAPVSVEPYPTGFEPLDGVLAGGFRMHDLALVAGLPGVGKTVVALQWARSTAQAGDHAIFVCYEHDEAVLLSRLLAMEVGDLAGAVDPMVAEDLRHALYAYAYGAPPPTHTAGVAALLQSARERLAAYADRLWLVRGSGTHTTLAELDRVLDTHAGDRTVLFVDYLQKVAAHPEPESEALKITRTAEGLKELALEHDAVIVAVTSASQDALEARRTRLHHLRGSSALAYECDVAIVLNEKMRAVSKVHLAYDLRRAERFKHQVVFSVEKNRGGPSLVDVEFTKDFANYRFDPKGTFVQERLVDERLDEQ